MFVVYVFIDIKAQQISEFKNTTIEYINTSTQKPGVEYFNLMQHQEKSSNFLLEENYNTMNDYLDYINTDHYRNYWCNINKMLMKPNNLFISDRILIPDYLMNKYSNVLHNIKYSTENNVVYINNSYYTLH